MKNPKILTLTAALLLLATPVLAGDGLLEIHQACVATGCFPGDTAGWPVTIANPGSYRLTSDLVVPDTDTTAVDISGARVTLDLSGFSILGPNSCSGFPVTSCSDNGTGVGVFQSTVYLVRVENGVVAGMGSHAVDLNQYGGVRNVQVKDCGGNGITAGRVRSSYVESILGNGIVAYYLAENNVVGGVGGVGIGARLARGNEVHDCTGLALDCSGGGGFAENVLRNCNGGSTNPQAAASCQQIGGNYCGATTCP